MGVNPLLTGMPFLYMYVRGYQNALRESKQGSGILRWCYSRRFATTIFSATQCCNIITTLFRIGTTLFQHCNLYWENKKRSIRVRLNRTTPSGSMYAILQIIGKPNTIIALLLIQNNSYFRDMLTTIAVKLLSSFVFFSANSDYK